MKNADIILNWLPPANERFSSAAMSVLQDFMNKNGISTKVIYWNLYLRNTLSSFYRQEVNKTDLSVLALFNINLALDLHDSDVLNRYKALLMDKQPSKVYLNSDVNQYLLSCINKLHNNIDSLFRTFKFQECNLFGFSLKLYQWIPAIVFAKKIKKLNEKARIIVGGINSKNEAIAFLKNFEDFDYAIWGEGEQSLLETVKAIKNGQDVSSIPHLAFRDNDKIVTNKVSFNYTDLSSEENVDYDDLLEALNASNLSSNDIQIMVEAGRGCHWQRCRFCFLNDGYHFRKKNPDIVVRELRHVIEKYRFQTFNFTDNDIVGGNINQFHDLLEKLALLKKQYPNFKIGMAEIITRGLSRDEFRKMAVAGFVNIQIGYESPSDAILRKINKSNSFASNLMAMKWCKEYQIRISGLNIIRGLLEETDEDILEAIANLKYERFFIDGKNIYHEYTDLAISEMSRYYKPIKESKRLCYYKSPLRDFIPLKLFSREDEFVLLSANQNEHNMLWDIYHNIDMDLVKKPFAYTMIKIDKSVLYKETRAGKLVRTLSFDTQSLEWRILVAYNDSVISFAQLKTQIITESSNNILSACSILSDIGLLYYNYSNDEFCTVINTDNYK